MEPQDWAINVRAVVRARQVDPEALSSIEGWEVYDHDEQSDGSIVIRCDQLVRVQATDEASAIEKAKDDATAIVLAGYEIEDVTLDVHEGIDVNPEFAEASGPSL